jgi:hypothetical protein
VQTRWWRTFGALFAFSLVTGAVGAGVGQGPPAPHIELPERPILPPRF